VIGGKYWCIINHGLLVMCCLKFSSISIIFKKKFEGVRVIVFNATFNNISAISWLSVLLGEEFGVPRENHQPDAIH
jgi:hypothetical protein